MTIKEMILKNKGLWYVVLKDKSKWIIDLDNNMFDNYKWYKEIGTLETDLSDEQLQIFLEDGAWSRIRNKRSII